MVFLDPTSLIGSIIIGLTTNVTGSLFITTLLIFFIIMGFFATFRLPIEVSAILVLPFAIMVMAFTSEFIAIGGAMLIYIAILFSKRFFLN